MKIGSKTYKKTGSGLLGIVDRFGKPLGVIVVAALILGAYSWAAADECQTRQMQVEEYEQTKEAYIAAEELASHEQVNQMVNSEEEDSSEESEPEWESLGEFRVTAYCGGKCCCGVWADEDCTTASGEKAVEGVTVAADTSVLPFDTVIRIGDEEYTVQDTGSAVQGNTIDIYFDDHQDALEHGVKYQMVEVKR
jgi:3D (Asp-Asp-Asp) domain-containing protein